MEAGLVNEFQRHKMQPPESTRNHQKPPETTRNHQVGGKVLLDMGYKVLVDMGPVFLLKNI